MRPSLVTVRHDDDGDNAWLSFSGFIHRPDAVVVQKQLPDTISVTALAPLKVPSNQRNWVVITNDFICSYFYNIKHNASSIIPSMLSRYTPRMHCVLLPTLVNPLLCTMAILLFFLLLFFLGPRCSTISQHPARHSV